MVFPDAIGYRGSHFFRYLFCSSARLLGVQYSVCPTATQLGSVNSAHSPGLTDRSQQEKSRTANRARGFGDRRIERSGWIALRASSLRPLVRRRSPAPKSGLTKLRLFRTEARLWHPSFLPQPLEKRNRNVAGATITSKGRIPGPKVSLDHPHRAVSIRVRSIDPGRELLGSCQPRLSQAVQKPIEICRILEGEHLLDACD